MGRGTSSFTWFCKGTCHGRHTSKSTWKCLKEKLKAPQLLCELPDCVVSSLCYHASIKQPLRIRLRMEFINIELNCLTTSCQTRKHCHTTWNVTRNVWWSLNIRATNFSSTLSYDKVAKLGNISWHICKTRMSYDNFSNVIWQCFLIWPGCSIWKFS